MRDFVLKKIARVIIRAPWFIIASALALTAASAVVTISRLQMHTDQDDLVSESLEYHRRYKDYIREFGDLEYLYVVIEVNNNIAEAKTFTRTLASRLDKIPDIREVVYTVSNPALEKSFLLYMSDEQLDQLTSFLTRGPTSIRNISSWKSLIDILKTMNLMMEQPDPKSAKKEMASGFYFLNELIDGIDETLATGKAREPQLVGAFLGSDEVIDEEGFLITRNGKLMFILIMPFKRYNTLSVIEKPLREIRKAISDTKAEFPNVQAGLTGRPVLQADEMSITNRDMTRATILAIVAITVIFVIYFKRLTRPIMAVTSLVFGITWTFGLTTLTLGYLNLLSTVFAVILVGAGIEFGLQIVSRYREELDIHKNPEIAVEKAITKTGKGNITAAMTTAAAFYTAIFTGFKALSELGFIAGTGVLLCLTSLLIVLPTMMFLRDRWRREKDFKTRLLVNLSGINYLYSRPKLIIGILIALTIIGLPGLSRLRFDHNLLNLQAKGLESVEYEKKIIEKSDESTWYAVAITRTPIESTAIAGLMREKPSVGKVETFEMIVPPNQMAKIDKIKTLKEAFVGISYPQIDLSIDKSALKNEIRIMSKNIDRLTETAFTSGYAEAVEELERINEKLGRIRRRLDDTDDKRLDELSSFQSSFIRKFRGGLNMLASGLTPQEIRLSDIPEPIRKKFVSGAGNYATYVYPKYDIWEPENLRNFINDIRDVYPEATGTPVEVFESSRLMIASFKKAAVYAFLIILLLVFIDFRRLKYSFFALVPLLAGIVWLLEIMGFAGIPFNLANFFAIPILLGVGVDNGVQLVHRFLEEGGDIKVMSKSTGAAVFLTSLTTGISFGMLILSVHRGIRSLGVVMALGALTCLIGSMLLLPVILKLLSLKKTNGLAK